jgi:hypothetical protein
MPEDFDFSNISPISLSGNAAPPEIPQNPLGQTLQQTPQTQQPKSLQDFDFTGIEPISLGGGVFSPPKKLITPGRIDFNPPDAQWDIGRLPEVEDYFRQSFGRNLPIANRGQGRVHNSLGLDHRNSADIGVNPNSKEGKALQQFFREKKIPFIAFDRAIPGEATGPHIHAGFPSHGFEGSFPVGTTLGGEPQVSQEEDFDFTGVDPISLGSQPTTTNEFVKKDNADANGKPYDPRLQVYDITNALDPLKLAIDKFKGSERDVASLAYDLAAVNKPIITGKNPFEVGARVTTFIPYTGTGKPENALGIESVLAKIDPSYAGLNAQFQKDTGGLNLLNVQNPANFITRSKNGAWVANARPTRSSIALVEAYKKGGLEEYNKTWELANNEKNDFMRENRAAQARIKDYQVSHPYTKAFDSGLTEASALATTQTVTNLRYLAKSLEVGTIYGYDSPEFMDVLNHNRDEQEVLNMIGQDQYNPPDTIGKLIKGGGEAIGGLPKVILAGGAGPAGLPVLSFIENLHLGLFEASEKAFATAAFVGILHGVGEFTSSVAKPTGIQRLGLSGVKEPGVVTSFEDLAGAQGPLNYGRASIEEVPYSTGGNRFFGYAPRVPTKYTREDLSLFTNRIAIGESRSLGNMTWLERQIMIRGANALVGGATSFIPAFFRADNLAQLTDPEHIWKAIEEGTNSMAVGLTYPIGKGPEQFRVPEYFGEAQRGITLGEPQGPETPRFGVTVTRPPAQTSLGTIGQDVERLPTTYTAGVSPDPYTNVLAETQRGFEATGNLVQPSRIAERTGVNLLMRIDDANLRLLELKRAFANKEWITPGITIQEALAKQQALKNAINELEIMIPNETKAFFEQHEEMIREGIRENNRKTSQALVRNGTELASQVKPVEAQSPKVTTGKETTSELFGGKVGDNNNGTGQEGAHKILQEFFNMTQEGQRILKEQQEGIKLKGDKSKEGSFGTFGTGLGAGGRALELTKQDIQKVLRAGKDSLDYLSAFFVEDMFLRGRVPTLDDIKKKVGDSLGEFGPHLSDEMARSMFQNGMDYYRANQADPFFSRMKQDVAERLPSTIKGFKESVIREATPAVRIVDKDTGEPIISKKTGEPVVIEAREAVVKAGRTASDQVRDFLKEHSKEVEWTVGLEDFLKENEGKDISKQDLINVINQGQVKVEESIGQEWHETAENKRIEAEIEALKKRTSEIRDEIFHATDASGNKLYKLQTEANDAYANHPDVAAINKRWDELSKQQQKLAEGDVPKYSLRRYTGEKLELPGAQGSKEVKLISPITTIERARGSFVRVPELDKKTEGKFAWHYEVENDEPTIVRRTEIKAGDTIFTDSPTEYPKALVDNYSNFKHFHWGDLANVIAHYRSTDRTFADKLNLIGSMFFGEEFQSDWNQIGRKKGFKNESDAAKEALALTEYLDGTINDLKQEQKKFDPKGSARQYEKIDAQIKALERRKALVRQELGNINQDLIEKNPFMGHNWKELIFKRFVRDGAVAKRDYGIRRIRQKGMADIYVIEENGATVKDSKNFTNWFVTKDAAQDAIDSLPKYKYDKIGWTTAKQQQERYGKLLEGKHFDWEKNSDGTYTFKLGIQGNGTYINNINWQNPHELSHITLERFEELTTPEAAQEVRDQEAKTFVKYEVVNHNQHFMGSADTLEEAEAIRERLPANRKSEYQIKRTGPHSPERGQFSLSDAVTLRGGNSYRIFDKDADITEDDPIILKDKANKFENKEEALAYLKSAGLNPSDYKITVPYADYDNAFVNYAKDLAKRFGAKYSTEEIKTEHSGNYGVYDRDGNLVYESNNMNKVMADAQQMGGTWEPIYKTETVHSLEINDAMRNSLEKRGFSFYSFTEPSMLETAPEGARNLLYTSEGFSKHRDELAKALQDTVDRANPAPDSGVSMMKVTNTTGEEKVAVGIDPSLIPVLAKNLYSGDIGTIVIKELLQNSADAIKGARALGIIDSQTGKITMNVSTIDKYIEIDDNGIGMPPEVMSNQFADLGGTLKQALDTSSGGYGIAKAAMFFNAQRIDVHSIYRDPKTGNVFDSLLTGSADDWLDPSKGLTLQSKNLGITPDAETGTTLKLQLKKGTDVQMNGSTAEKFLKNFAYSHRLGMDLDLKINGNQIDETSANRSPVNLVKSIQVPGAALDIYISPDSEETNYPAVTLLNHGLPQTKININVGESAKFPKNIIVDVKSEGGPKSANYPWQPSREDLRSDAKIALNNYFKVDLFSDAAAKERQAYATALENATDIPNTTIQPLRERAELKVTDVPEEERLKVAKELFGEKYSWEYTTQEMQLAFEEIKSRAEAKKQTTTADIPTTQKVVDTNVGQPIPKKVVTEIANDKVMADFSTALSNITKGIMQALAPYHSSYTNAEYYGFGLGQKYYAVNVLAKHIYGELAKNVILLNPFNSMDTVENLATHGVIGPKETHKELARHLTASIVHELTHQPHRSHDENFSSELTDNIGRTQDQQNAASATLHTMLAANNGELYNKLYSYNNKIRKALREYEDIHGDTENIFGKIAATSTAESPERYSGKESISGNKAEPTESDRNLPSSGERSTEGLGDTDIRTNNERIEDLEKVSPGFTTNFTNVAIESGNKGTVFNSGLSPDAFIDQAKLLYRGLKDFGEFSNSMIERFGGQVKPYLRDLWIQVKGLWQKFNYEGSTENINELNANLNPVALLKKAKIIREKPLAERKDIEKNKRNWFFHPDVLRGVAIAQAYPLAGVVYDVTRMGQRDMNSFEHRNVEDLNNANKIVKSRTQDTVAEVILIGNETQRLFTPAELARGDTLTNRPALNPEQIEAYNNVYKAEHRSLDHRAQQVLFGYQQRAIRLNDNLQALNPNDPNYVNRSNSIKTQILDNADDMTKILTYYNKLKQEGYISLQRKGDWAGFVHDPAFPAGDPRGKIYRQFESRAEAGKWVKAQEQALGANENLSDVYQINKPENLRAAAKNLSPAQFESLVDASGANSRSQEVQELRDEVYSRYPSKGYELKRDYVRGYERNWKFVISSVADQTQVYANSFYSRVAGEQAIRALEASGLQNVDYKLYTTMQKYIDHEISAPEKSVSGKTFSAIRKGVYLYQLGFDFNQLYLNAIAQPVTQTYSYFARVEHNGIRLKGLEPEKYWARASALAGTVLKDHLTGSTDTPADFQIIRQRLIEEGVLTPEFNKQLLEGESSPDLKSKLEGRNKWKLYEHWSGVFMRNGEKTTRNHVAAEAYLVGKEKFNLQGEELTNFIVRAVDATQSNPTRAEAPLIFRGKQNQAEVRKLLYQFNAFNWMWMENLALNVREDFKARRISATSRHLAPVALMGGIAGLPLSGIAAGLYTLITGDDPREKFHKIIHNFPLLEKLALYGMTGNATLSARLTPSIPFLEQIDLKKDVLTQVQDLFTLEKIPAVATAGQLAKGLDDLRKGEYLRGFSEVIPFRPARNILRAVRYAEEGIKNRTGKTLVPEISKKEIAGQVLGVAPASQSEYYSDQAAKRRATIMKSLRKKILK